MSCEEHNLLTEAWSLERRPRIQKVPPALTRGACAMSSQDESANPICRHVTGHPKSKISATKPSPHSFIPLVMLLCSPRRLLKTFVPHAHRRDIAMTICPTHLIHLVFPRLIILDCVVISCEVGWRDLGTHGILRCFSF